MMADDSKKVAIKWLPPEAAIERQPYITYLDGDETKHAFVLWRDGHFIDVATRQILSPERVRFIGIINPPTDEELKRILH